MKKTKSLMLLLALLCVGAQAVGQSCYWVAFTDKQGATFDPYAYFDAKAVARYRQCGADLGDSSNYPLCGRYVAAVDALVEEDFGQSRWLNAVAVEATPDEIARVATLPFVREVRPVASEGQPAGCGQPAAGAGDIPSFYPQVARMEGDLFQTRGIDGRGIRIAVFDAGFPRVNTHQAFRHLRDSNRIIDTWNFPNGKADVYGWNAHGLMTLSCIAGMMDGKRLGMATGAEFLLYRTEVETEPFKEEVWWAMAAERADKQGADIISSSLGYGKERYYSDQMDGTSYVAKAAGMAAEKGMLVCCSAGNEGTDKRWKTIVTPSDADGVLCVGGISASENRYIHISFSSYGPSADWRVKPDVAAYGHATVASNLSDSKVASADGTSFSCPLVAGFAACAWQASPGKTGAEMYRAIRQSADRYPYFDYAMGYGVPQASYFLAGMGAKSPSEPTFEFVDTAEYVLVRLRARPASEYANVFFNRQRPDGRLDRYGNFEAVSSDSSCLRFGKAALDSCRLNVSYLGYTDSFVLSEADRLRYQDSAADFRPFAASLENGHRHISLRTPADDLRAGRRPQFMPEVYFQLGSSFRTATAEQRLHGWPVTTHLGFRGAFGLSKDYSLGAGVEWGRHKYKFDPSVQNQLDEMLNPSIEGVPERKILRRDDFSLELFQRVRLLPASGKGLYWDLGFYVSGSIHNYIIRSKGTLGERASVKKELYTYRSPKFLDRRAFNYGITTRVGYQWIALFLRYRLTDIGASQMVPAVWQPGNFYINIPRFEAGLQLSL